MKKFLLTMAAGVFAFLGANAQATLYMTGNLSASTWNPGSPIELTPTNSEYTYTFPTNSSPQFKISTTKGSSSSDWNGFNSGVLGYNNNDGNIPINQEVQLYSGRSGNSQTPAADDYTLKIRYASGTYYMTVSTASGATPEVKIPEQVYVRGDINSWGGADSPLKLKSQEKIDGYYVFEGTLPTLSKEFKIAEDLTDSWSGINFGSGDQRSPIIGQQIECWSGGQNFICSGTFTNITLTFKYDDNTNNPSYLYATSSQGVSYPETLYIIGNVNGKSFNPQEYGASVKGNEGVYTFTDVVVSSANLGYGYFGFTSTLGTSDSDWETMNAGRYGAASGDLEVKAGDSGINMVSGQNSWKILAGTYTFTVDLTKGTFSITGDADKQELPETLYMIGQVNDFGFASNKGIDVKGVEGVYTYSNVKVNNADEGYGYFGFTTALGTTGTDSDWDVVNAGRYGAQNENQAVAAGDSDITIVASQNSWKILAGTYTFTVNLNNNTLAITGTADEPVTPPTPDEFPEILYILGDSFGWDATDANKMTTTENEGIYTFSCEKLEGKFKFNNGAWDQGWNLGAGENTQITVDQAQEVINDSGSGNFVIAEDTYIANANVVLNLSNMTVTVTGTETKVETPYVPEVIYLKSSINDWGEGVALKKTESGLYIGTFSMEASAEPIECKLDAGNNKWYGYAPGEQNITFTNDKAELKLDSDGGNWIITNWDGGVVTVSVDWENKLMTVMVSAFTDSDGISSLESVDGEAVIYNLQGVRVANPTKGLYIINGKKVLVK